jgi:hypothetical protein
MNRLCENALGQLEQHFGYLERNHGFRRIAVEPSSAGNRCLVILEGPCRIRFVFDLGGTEVSVGSLEAPIGWGDKSAGRRRWFPVWGVINRARGLPKLTPEQFMELGRKLLSDGHDAYLARLAASLDEVMDQVAAGFAPARAEQEEQSLEAYCFG